MTMRPAGLERRRARGFGLLEVLVALVILAGAGTATFGWINVNLETVRKLRQREAEEHLRTQMAAWVQTLNPARQPQGSTELVPGLPLRWSARVIVPPQPVPPLPGGTTTPFRLGLYEVRATVPGPAGELLWSGQRVGIERDADPAGLQHVPR